MAGRTFFIGVSFMTITDVAPVLATACVMGIVGLLGCVLGAHIMRCRVDTLEVSTVVLLSSLCILLVGYKVGDETNDFTHLCVTCFAPHRHIVGN
jgi:hypothetical protein